ncbi:MAG: hypothetical protein MUF33_11315 [Candidatus Nanopelagicales bacterium]|nr:hypothetical protein [Candidatus Nanopelagicales bacterium]
MVSRTLNDRQQQVLKRLASGEVITRRETELVVTVYALRNRRLVETVKGEGRIWTAQITDAGRLAAETGLVPPEVALSQGRARAKPIAAAASTEKAKPLAPSRAPSTSAPVASPRRPRVAEVRREVLQATRAALKGRADEKGLLHAGGSGVVRVSVSRDQISRAIALIDQVLAGAESRGMQVKLVPLTSPWARDKATQVQIVDRDLGFTFSVKEQSTRIPHEPTPAEKARQSKHSWATPPEWDYKPSGLLRVDLGQEHTRAIANVRSRFADGRTTRIESKVEELLNEISRRADGELARLTEERRLDAVYAVARVAAVQRARERYWEDLRVAEVAAQVANWERAEGLRRFLGAMRARGGGQPNDWLDWIESHIESLDPRERLPEGPNLPAEPREGSDLAPYLRAWPAARPYGWTDTLEG